MNYTPEHVLHVEHKMIQEGLLDLSEHGLNENENALHHLIGYIHGVNYMAREIIENMEEVKAQQQTFSDAMRALEDNHG